MTFDEFKTEANKLSLLAWNEHSFNPHDLDKDRFICTNIVNIDGYCGGNCWDDIHPEYYSVREPEPFIFTYLQILLKTVLKQDASLELLYLIYDSINYFTAEVPGYYGNQDNYHYRAVNVYQLYTILRPFM